MATVARASPRCCHSAVKSIRTPTLARSTLHTSARQSKHIPSMPAPQTLSIPRTRHSTALPYSAAQQSRKASSVSTANQSAVPAEDVLTWDRFFALRKRRRYINLASSLVTGVGACVVFGPILAQQDVDGWAAQVSGLDPIIVLGACTLAVGAGGWLCGPTFGNSAFKLWAGRKGWNGPIAEKEKSFFARIKRYRADPSSSSPQNPIPDYYGEKIASVKDYRRWLKDQRAFNLKKNKNML